MNQTVVNNGRRGIGFFGLLTIVLVILKALGYISWSWWSIAGVFFFPVLLILGIFLVVFIGAVLLFLVSHFLDNWGEKRSGN